MPTSAYPPSVPLLSLSAPPPPGAAIVITHPSTCPCCGLGFNTVVPAVPVKVLSCIAIVLPGTVNVCSLPPTVVF